ncbi:hypothetical protein [Amphritea sp. HPY]|uniref:hypothetical protein n=1 Tax=Amphritea sp. HPY TaxID=3421652 RepID=UPI003D7E06FA
MFNLKAFIIGCITVIVVGLTLQLGYVLLASYISTADSGDGFFSTYQSELWFISAMLVYGLTMLAGGAVTALISGQCKWLTPALVGLSTSLLSLLTSSSSGDITWFSILMIFASVGVCVLGSQVIPKRWQNVTI